MKKPVYYETTQYRCLVYQEKQSDDLYLLLCGIEQCFPGYEFHTGNREGYHLHVILKGKGMLSVNGRQTQLHQGQLFITKPEEDTWYRADETEPWNYCWMTFGGELAHKYCEEAGFVDQVNFLDCHITQSKFYALVKQVLDRPEMTLANEVMRVGILFQFLSLAIESNEMSQPHSQREIEFSTDVYVDYAMTYILGNYATAKITDVAKYIGITRSYLTHIFKEKIGVSPQEYLIKCRIDRAKYFLQATSLSIKEISNKVGYNNPMTFSKIFRNRCGISPTQYRETTQNVTKEKDQTNEHTV